MPTDHPEAAPSVEELFRAWRSGADPDAIGEVLARTEPELVAVARREARDEARAWDLVQETYLTVLRDAHKWDEGQRLVPWLVGVLSICARRARRDEARVPDPGRLPEREAETPEREVPRGEVRGLVEGAIVQLPRLYGEVVSMHLLDQLSHAEIAARTGRAPGTVRVQVFRGLEQLRRLLPVGLSLSAALAVLAPRSEALPLAPVLDAAARVRLAPAAAAAGTATSLAALRWLGAALVLALGAAGTWWALHEHDAGPLRGAAPVAPLASAPDSPAEVDLARAGSAGAREVARTEAAPDAAPAPDSPGVWLVATIAGLDGLPESELTLTLRPEDTRAPPRVVPLAAAPRCALSLSDWYAEGGLAPRQFWAVLDHPHALPARVLVALDAPLRAAARAAAAGDGSRCELAARFELARPVARVLGRVALAEELGADAPALRALDACVGLFALQATGEPEREPVEARPVAPDGTFVLRAAAPGAHLLAVALRGARVANLPLALAPADERDVGTVELEPGFVIAGFARAPGGQPAGGASVQWRVAEAGRAGRAMHGLPVAWVAGRLELASGDARADEDGAFQVAGLAPVEHALIGRPRVPSWQHVVTLPDEGFPPREAPQGEVRVVAGARGVRLPVAGLCAPLLVRGAGAPLARAEVDRFYADGSGYTGATTDEAGRALLYTTGDAGVVPLRISSPGWTPRTIEVDTATLDPARELVVDLERGPAPVALSFDAGGLDLSGVSVHLVPRDAIDAAGWERLRTQALPPFVPGYVNYPLDAEGRLPQPVPAGRWVAVLWPGSVGGGAELGNAQRTVVELDLAPGTTVRERVQLVTAGRLALSAVGAVPGADGVHLRLERADGTAVSLELTTFQLRRDARAGKTRTVDWMPFGVPAESGPLEPGTYTLRAEAGGRSSARTVEVRAGETLRVELGL